MIFNRCASILAQSYKGVGRRGGAGRGGGGEGQVGVGVGRGR